MQVAIEIAKLTIGAQKNDQNATKRDGKAYKVTFN